MCIYEKNKKNEKINICKMNKKKSLEKQENYFSSEKLVIII